MREDVRIWETMREYERIWKNMRECERILENMTEYERIWEDMKEFERIREDLRYRVPTGVVQSNPWGSLVSLGEFLVFVGSLDGPWAFLGTRWGFLAICFWYSLCFLGRTRRVSAVSWMALSVPPLGTGLTRPWAVGPANISIAYIFDHCTTII